MTRDMKWELEQMEQKYGRPECKLCYFDDVEPNELLKLVRLIMESTFDEREKVVIMVNLINKIISFQHALFKVYMREILKPQIESKEVEGEEDFLNSLLK